MRRAAVRLLAVVGAVALGLAACEAPTRPVLRERTPFERARAAIDSLNVALFAMHQQGETATLEIYVDERGKLFLILRQP